MANYTYTTNRLESPYRYDAVNDWSGFQHNPETIYRRKCAGISASMESVFTSKTAPYPNKAGGLTKTNKPTVPQFSGVVDPSGVREVALCQYQDNDPAKLNTVLEIMPVDAGGNFQCAGWYKPRENGKYFFRIIGDKNYSSKDFPVQPPVENEKRFGYMVNQDTALNIQQEYVYDTFTDSEGTSITAHTPEVDDVGTGWATNGSILLTEHTTGNFVAYSGSSAQVAHIDANDSDVVITCEFIFGETALQSGEHGLVIRYVDDNNYLRAVIYDADKEQPKFVLISKVGGVDTLLKEYWFPSGNSGKANVTFTITTAYRMRLVIKGSTLICDLYRKGIPFLNGGRGRRATLIHKNVTDHASATEHGFIIGGSEMYVDNFHMKSV